MKKLILSVITLTSAASLFAQGTVAFQNRVPGVGTNHVWIGPYNYQGSGINDSPAGNFDYAAHGFHLIGTGPNGLFEAQHTFAQLLGAPGSNVPESNLLPGLPVTTFRTGAAFAGGVALATVTFNNILPDAFVGTFKMVAWDNSSGLYPTWTEASVAWLNGLIIAGQSAPFVLQEIGGTTFTPPFIVSSIPGQGMQSFGFGIPEPTTIALAALGVASLLMFPRLHKR